MSKALVVGALCEINGVRGVVRFIGETRFAPGKWVGVELDTATGKNDGEVQGERYFSCPPEHGVFVRPIKVALVSEEPEERAEMHTQTSTSRTLAELVGRIKALEAQRSIDAQRLARLSELESTNEIEATIKNKLMQRLQSQQADLRACRKSLALLQEELLQTKAQLSEARDVAIHDGKLAELSEALEMATLQKEEAEEERELLTLDIKAMRERVEELQLELDIMKEDVPMEEEASTESRSLRNLEAQNERLKDALVRLDEVSREQQKQIEEHDNAEGGRQAELANAKLAAREALAKLNEHEASIEDLKQRLDLSIGSEDMLEALADRNLLLSEQLAVCKQEIADLEALKDLADELDVTQRREAFELRDQIYQRENALAELSQTARQEQERADQYGETIVRLKELIENLQGQLIDADVLHGRVQTTAQESAQQIQKLRSQRLDEARNAEVLTAMQWDLAVSKSECHILTDLLKVEGSSPKVGARELELEIALIPLLMSQAAIDAAPRKQRADLLMSLARLSFRLCAATEQQRGVRGNLDPRLAEFLGSFARRSRELVLGNLSHTQLRKDTDDLLTGMAHYFRIGPRASLGLLHGYAVAFNHPQDVRSRILAAQDFWLEHRAPDAAASELNALVESAIASSDSDQVLSIITIEDILTRCEMLARQAEHTGAWYAQQRDDPKKPQQDAQELDKLRQALDAAQRTIQEKEATLEEERLRGEVLRKRAQEESRLLTRISELEQQLKTRPTPGSRDTVKSLNESATRDSTADVELTPSVRKGIAADDATLVRLLALFSSERQRKSLGDDLYRTLAQPLSRRPKRAAYQRRVGRGAARYLKDFVSDVRLIDLSRDLAELHALQDTTRQRKIQANKLQHFHNLLFRRQEELYHGIAGSLVPTE
ncbi:hypothetical protein PYCC9005_004032 [Savitreella phatthalungensis]